MSNPSCIYLDYNGTTPIDPRVGMYIGRLDFMLL